MTVGANLSPRLAETAQPLSGVLNAQETADGGQGTSSAGNCSIPGCERGGRMKRGWCSMHYSRWRKFGNPLMLEASHELVASDPLHSLIAGAKASDQPCINGCNEIGRPLLCTRCLHRFYSKAQPSDGGCWLWTGTITTDGYAMFGVKRRNRLAHRLAYEQMIGPVPEGLVLDHLCRVRNCVNPAHLDPVVQQVNVARGVGLAALTRRVGVCQRGHEMSGDNVVVIPSDPGRRRCRKCQRIRDRRRRAA